MANEKAGPMNRADVAGAIAAKFNISQTQADAITREYEAAIVRAISSGQEVRLNGFGSFKIQHRAARMARNPQTGEMKEVGAKDVPKFQPSKAMRDALLGDASTANATTKGGKAAKSSAAKSESKAGGAKAAAKAPAAKAAAAKAPAKKKK
jgi:nucleoid DNA-binding protein